MFYETKEGEIIRFGVNYWFPEGNLTSFRIIIAIPFCAFYSQYEHFDTGNTVKSWRFPTILIRFRKRNPKTHWPKATKINLFNISYCIKNGKQHLVETFEQKEDRGLA